MIPFIHNVKILPEYFSEVCAGKKTAELRLCDRRYTEGDSLVLHEFDGEKFTGKMITVRITHILRDHRFVKEGFVLLSFVISEPGEMISNVAWMNLFDMYCDKRKEVEELKSELQSLRKELMK